MYEKDITTKHKTLFVIAVDRSLSMNEKITDSYGRIMTKAEAVSVAVSNMISELVNRARRDVDDIRDYYDVALLGYSGEGVYSLTGESQSLDGCAVAITDIAARKPQRCHRSVEVMLDDGRMAVKNYDFDLWLEPHAEGNTPMYEAFLAIYDIVGKWCADERNADSFPPVVINVTDGEASDCDGEELRKIAGKIKSLHTADGNVLLINVHISSDSARGSLLFPTEGEIVCDDRYVRLLADCSSRMPEPFNAQIRELRGDASRPPFVAMSYNASAAELLSMLDIGSRSVTNVR